MTNEKNKVRLVSFYYFLAGLNNKFINGIKAKVGFLLDASETSSLVIETLADAGLTVKHETIVRQKTCQVEAHTVTLGKFLLENVSIQIFFLTLLFVNNKLAFIIYSQIKNLIVLNIDDFYNIYKYRHSDIMTTHEVSYFITILLKALSETVSIPFYNPNQEENVHNEKSIDENIIILNAHTSFFLYLWFSYKE